MSNKKAISIFNEKTNYPIPMYTVIKILILIYDDRWVSQQRKKQLIS